MGASADQLALPLTNSDLSHLPGRLTSLCAYSPSAWQVRISIHPHPAGCPLRTLSRESLLLSACWGPRPRQAESEAGGLVLAARSPSGQSLGGCRGPLRPQRPRRVALQQLLPGVGVPPLTLPPDPGLAGCPRGRFWGGSFLHASPLAAGRAICSRQGLRLKRLVPHL